MTATDERVTGSAHEVVLTRVYSAPRALVFLAWTDPKHLANWWGPRGFTNPVCELDVRPGGAILVHMTAPDGTMFPMTGTFHEIVEPERLVFTTRAFEDATGQALLEVHNTVTFTDEGGKTKLTVRAVAVKVAPEVAGAVAGMNEGWAQSLDKLGELVVPGEAEAAAREIVLTRVFDAPRERVFDAWTDAKHLEQWWGPNGFGTTTRTFDLRVGGEWRLVMHGPDGRDYANRIVFTTIARPQCLAYRHEGDGGVTFFSTVTFDEEGAGTKLTLRMRFSSAEECAAVEQKYGAREGGRQTLLRLGEFLAQKAPAREFVLSRTFDAPRSLVFRAWTEADRLAKWFGPKGFTLLSCALDLRPGGVFHYGMKAPQGGEMWGKWVFREVVPPERLVFVTSFSDAECGTGRHPLSAEWPLEVLSVVTFTEHAGKTTITLSGVPINATEAERKTFDAAHEGMRGGWGGTLDQLAEFLVAR